MPLTTTAAQPACAVLVRLARLTDPAFEIAVTVLAGQGYPVRNVTGALDRAVEAALADGFDELLLLDSAVVFDPADVAKLRGRGLPFVCGLYALDNPRTMACDFRPDTAAVRFGPNGGPLEVLAAGLGFALVRREVFVAVGRASAGPTVRYFASDTPPGPDAGRTEDHTFCQRARACGFPLVADTSVRLWRVGPYRYGWEDAGGTLPRFGDYTLHLKPPALADEPAPPAAFRPPAGPLPAGFPKVGLYIFTYPANRESFELTLASVRASDWGEEPTVVVQPADWPAGNEAASATYKRVMARAVADGCDFAVVLEDDVRVGRHLRRNLLALPLVARDECDYLGLFLPDLIADPWEREEPALGYRLARPRYVGPDRLWERGRVWGSQALAFSRRFLLAALPVWDRFPKGQDARLMGVCSHHHVSLWYTAPCLVQHAPLRTAFNTPAAYAPDFDPDFRLDVRAGFQPPEAVPGRLTRAEAELLWRTADGWEALELGAGGGRGTVCLAQAARRVVSVDLGDPAEAAEWVRRYGAAGRVEFRRGRAAEVIPQLATRFGLAVVGGDGDAGPLDEAIATAGRAVLPGGLVAVRDYPDPARPAVRKLVDEHARRHNWRRVAQAGYVAVFKVP